MVYMLTFGVYILMVNVTIYSIHGSYGIGESLSTNQYKGTTTGFEHCSNGHSHGARWKRQHLPFGSQTWLAGKSSIHKWGFSMGVPQHGWFLIENPIKIG